MDSFLERLMGEGSGSVFGSMATAEWKLVEEMIDNSFRLVALKRMLLATGKRTR